MIALSICQNCCLTGWNSNFRKALKLNVEEMVHAPSNPHGICVGMDISVGAFKHEEEKKEGKKATKYGEGLVLGEKDFFHGILPQWKFIEEKYFEKWEKKQEKYRQRLRDIKKTRVSSSKNRYSNAHNELLYLAGPEWYQELSPQQKELIDNLKTAIKKDLDGHFTKATQSTLSLLGLRPLPNDSQLWKALTKSFGCPVEFLLEMYELIKPQGNFYSINDRLLLSGVAHLCLKDTLKEMHIRSPSPPRVEKKPPPPKPKPKKKKYESVYLVPFVHEWPQRKTDKYKNPVIRRPTCPYFSYICEYERTRLRKCDEFYGEDRADEDIRIPCDLFEDHIVAEEYYNLVFKRGDAYKYIILRPRIYKSSTPKTYPGILPKYMIPKKYPPPIKLIVDVKIYDEINMTTQKKRKVIRTICEVRMKPGGRPGQSFGQKLLAKYVYIKNIGRYLEKCNASESENASYDKDYPCSICGGPERKQILPEIKPIKERSWIKRPRPKKKVRKIVYTNLSDYIESDIRKIDMDKVDAETRALIKDNQNYIKTWNVLFDNIAQMEKLRIETGTCVCPGKTTDPHKFDPHIDCTCAVWNLPPAPKPIPPKISCECDPKLEEIYIPPKEDKCDCKQKAKEKAMEKCERCGKTIEKTEEELAEKGECDCTKILDACGNCVKQTPMKFPLLEGETKKECECIAKPPEGGKEVTVAYVFVDNQLKYEPSVGSEKKDCGCRIPKHVYEEKSCNCKKKREAKLKRKQEKIKEKLDKKKADKKLPENDKEKKEAKEDLQKITEEGGTKEVTENTEEKKKGTSSEKIGDKPSKKEVKCLVECGKILELDHCRRETKKLLNLLKCGCPKCKDLRKRYRAKYVQAGTRDGCGGILPVIGGVYGGEKDCDCLEKFERRVEGVKDYKERMRAKMDLKSQKDKFIISGVHQTHKGPVYNLAGVMPTKPCICKTSKETLAEKREDEKLTSKLKPGLKHVITGVKGGPESHEYIIGGLSKECECSEVYKKFMQEHNECLVNYEKYLKYMEKEIQAYMEDMNERYKDPPLTAEKLVEYELKRMTGAPGLPLPGGRSEFLISGVQAKELGKVFILGGMLRNQKDDDECMIAVESYTHIPEVKGTMSKCQKSFLCNYMTFGRNCGNPFKPAREVEIRNSSEEVVCQCISYESFTTKEESVEEEEILDGCACECPCGVEIEKLDDCSCAAQKEESEESCVCAEIDEEEEEEEIESPDGCTCGVVETESSGTASDPCLCDVKNCGCQVDEVCVKECFYGPMEAWWSDEELKKKEDEEKLRKGETTKSEEGSEESVIPYGGPSKRYVVLREIPKKRIEQIRFLEKLLNGLAEDGFPLAQLPDCSRLPYFRLWLQFRMRKKWDYDQGVRNLKKCQRLWNHIEVCKRKLPYPKLPLYCVCEEGNYTWREAARVSKMVAATKNKFYENARRNMVDYAREFYATLQAYQFPNSPYFNHNFFAYQPGKVENVLARFVWEDHEHKNPRDYKSCLCK